MKNTKSKLDKITCTPAVAAVRPVKAEFLRHPTHAPECSVNVGLAHGEICNCHRMLNPVTSELAAKFAAGWQKSIEAGSVRLELDDLRKFIQSVAATSNGSRMVSQNCLAASQILESAIIERGELLAALEDIVTAIPPIGELELRDRISTINGIAREAIARARGQ